MPSPSDEVTVQRHGSGVLLTLCDLRLLIEAADKLCMVEEASVLVDVPKSLPSTLPLVYPDSIALRGATHDDPCP